MKLTLLRFATGISAAVFAGALGLALPEIGGWIHAAIFAIATILTALVAGFAASLLPAIAGSAFVLFITSLPLAFARPLQSAATFAVLTILAALFRRRARRGVDPLSQARKVGEPLVTGSPAVPGVAPPAAAPPLEPLIDPATIALKRSFPSDLESSSAPYVPPAPPQVESKKPAPKIADLKTETPDASSKPRFKPAVQETLAPVDRAAVDEFLGRFTPNRDAAADAIPASTTPHEEPWFQPAKAAAQPAPQQPPPKPPIEPPASAEETSFRILPQTRNEPSPAVPPPAPEAAKRNDPPIVLLVEDESEMLAIVSHTVRTMGYRLVVARDGEEGIRLARQEKPDLVLADALIPKLDGREMCRMIKEDPSLPPMKTVVMTGVYTYNKYKNEALARFRVDNYIFKPINLEELEAVLTKHLGSQRT